MKAFTRTAAWVLLTAATFTGVTAPPVWTAEVVLSGPVKGTPVKNYGIVAPGFLSRSARPAPDGYAWLRGQGVKSIVNFTDRDAGEAFLKELGFERYLWLPIKGDTPPTDRQAEQFLTFVQDAMNRPVHIHCAAGKSRTGVMAALFRYAVDGWPLEKALEEARLYRKGKALDEEHVEWLKRWAERHAPGSYRPAREG